MFSARRGWLVIATPRSLYPRTDAVRVVQEAGWASGLVWTDVEYLVPTRAWTLDHPALSKPLYFLRYPDHHIDDRLKYNILSYFAPVEYNTIMWVLKMEIDCSSCNFLIIHCHNTKDHILKQTDCVFRSGGFHQWRLNSELRMSVHDNVFLWLIGSN